MCQSPRALFLLIRTHNKIFELARVHLGTYLWIYQAAFFDCGRKPHREAFSCFMQKLGRASEKKRRQPDIIPGSFIIYKGPCVCASVRRKRRVYLFLIPQSLLQCTPLGSGQKVGLLVFVCVRRISSHFAFQQTTAVFLYPLACGMGAEEESELFLHPRTRAPIPSCWFSDTMREGNSISY